MTICIRIDRLVLDGLPVGQHEGGVVSRALRAELTRLVRAHGLNLPEGFAVPHLQVGSVDLDRRPASSAVGHRIARALYAGLTPGSDVRPSRT